MHFEIQHVECFVIQPSWLTYEPDPGEHVIHLDPGNRTAIQSLGEANRRSGRVSPPEEPSVTQPLREEEEEGEEFHFGEEIAFFTFSMAEVYEQQGFFEKALTIYQRVLTLQPHREDVRERIEKLKRKLSAV